MAKKDPRWRKFVHNYFYGKPGVVGNAEKSATAAGYSEVYARTHAWSFVGECREKSKNKDIWDMVQKERAKFEKNYEMTEAQILRQYKRLSTFDIRKLYDEKGAPIPIHKLDDDTAAAIAGVDLSYSGADENFTGTTKIKIVDKKAALDSLAKIKGMFIDRKELSFNKDNLQEILALLPEAFKKAVMKKLEDYAD